MGRRLQYVSLLAPLGFASSAASLSTDCCSMEMKPEVKQLFILMLLTPFIR